MNFVATHASVNTPTVLLMQDPDQEPRLRDGAAWFLTQKGERQRWGTLLPNAQGKVISVKPEDYV